MSIRVLSHIPNRDDTQCRVCRRAIPHPIQGVPLLPRFSRKIGIIESTSTGDTAYHVGLHDSNRPCAPYKE